MASFDIQLLFINISLDETIDICVDETFGKKKKVKGMLKRHIKQILILSVKSSCFLFNDLYYKQIDGTMGYPLGPTYIMSVIGWKVAQTNFSPNIIVDSLMIPFLCLSTKIM